MRNADIMSPCFLSHLKVLEVIDFDDDHETQYALMRWS